MDKRVADAQAVIARVRDGATILMGGFGQCGIPEPLISAVRAAGVKNLTVVLEQQQKPGRFHGIGLLLRNAPGAQDDHPATSAKT